VQQRHHVFTFATTNTPISPHTSCGEILAIVDSGTSKHILQCRTLLANAQEAHVAVSSFAGDTSRSTYSGDLLCTMRTEDGQLLPLSDISSALVVPDAKRPLWSVRHAQLAGHEIVLGAKPGLLLQGNPRYFVPFINCPETSLWLIRLLPPPTLHNRIYPIHLATPSTKSPRTQASEYHDTRLQDHERLGHMSFKRMRQLNIDGVSAISRPRMLVAKQNTVFGKVSVHLSGVGWGWRMGVIQARAVNEDTWHIIKTHTCMHVYTHIPFP